MYLTVAQRETDKPNMWEAVVASYESREIFEYYDGDCRCKVLRACGHCHQPYSKRLGKCLERMERYLVQTYSP